MFTCTTLIVACAFKDKIDRIRMVRHDIELFIETIILPPTIQLPTQSYEYQPIAVVDIISALSTL